MTIQKPKVFWPVTISAANNKIYWVDAASANGEGTIANATYYSAVDLAAAVQTAIRGGSNPLTTVVVSVSATGHFVFTDSAIFQMRWATTTNSVYAILGATAVTQMAGPEGGNLVVTTVYQHQNGWYSDVMVYEDSAPIRDASMDTVTVNVAGQTKFISEVELTKRQVIFRSLSPEKTYLTHATGVYTNGAIESWWYSGRARFRYWPDGTVEGTYTDYVLDLETIQQFAPRRQYKLKALYEIELGFRGFVA